MQQSEQPIREKVATLKRIVQFTSNVALFALATIGGMQILTWIYEYAFRTVPAGQTMP